MDKFSTGDVVDFETNDGSGSGVLVRESYCTSIPLYWDVLTKDGVRRVSQKDMKLKSNVFEMI